MHKGVLYHQKVRYSPLYPLLFTNRHRRRHGRAILQHISQIFHVAHGCFDRIHPFICSVRMHSRRAPRSLSDQKHGKAQDRGHVPAAQHSVSNKHSISTGNSSCLHIVLYEEWPHEHGDPSEHKHLHGSCGARGEI